MRRISLALILTVVGAAGSATADPFYGFFDYQKPLPPVAGDCAAIAAAIGVEATWYGEFSARRLDNQVSDKYEPFSAQGCFESEWDCRIWHQQAITYIDGGPIYYATCRRGAYGY